MPETQDVGARGERAHGTLHGSHRGAAYRLPRPNLGSRLLAPLLSVAPGQLFA